MKLELNQFEFLVVTFFFFYAEEAIFLNIWVTGWLSLKELLPQDGCRLGTAGWSSAFPASSALRWGSLVWAKCLWKRKCIPASLLLSCFRPSRIYIELSYIANCFRSAHGKMMNCSTHWCSYALSFLLLGQHWNTVPSVISTIFFNFFI